MKFTVLLLTAAFCMPLIGCKSQLSGAKAAYERQDWETALKLAEPLAEKGNAQTQVEMGQLYLGSHGVEYNSEKATGFFRRAADQGDAEGQFWLGYIYESRPPDWKKDYSGEMVKWYRKAAEQGNVAAEMHLATCYEHGRGAISRNDAEAFKLYSDAAKRGEAEAQYDVGRFYHDGIGVKQDYEKALAWYRKAADHGYSVARLSLAGMYSRGEGVKQDAAEAAKWRNSPKMPEEVSTALDGASSVTLYSIQPWGGPDLPEWDFHGHHQLGHVELTQEKAKQAVAALREAVAEGSADWVSACLINPRHAIRVMSKGSTYDILICYECGQLEIFKDNAPLPFTGSIGGKPVALNNLLKEAAVPLEGTPAALQHSYDEEAKTAMRRAKQGDAKAQEMLGVFLTIGRGVKKDENQGIRWLAKSYGASVDDPDFEVKLGKMLRNSQDRQSHEAEIMHLFKAAADKGNAEGQYQLGYLYKIGEGAKGNQTEALKWFRVSADQGNPKAQYQLGVLYAKGWAVKQDDPEALKWFRKAAEQGHPEAMHLIAGMYQKGLGVGKDLGEAFFWYQLAKEYYTIYGSQPFYVSAEQKAAAQKRVTEWKSGHPSCPDNCHS